MKFYLWRMSSYFGHSVVWCHWFLNAACSLQNDHGAFSSPDTSTKPSFVLTLSSSGLKLCTFTHTFHGSSELLGDALDLRGVSLYLELKPCGAPMLVRGKPVRNEPVHGVSRRALSRGRAQPGQSIDMSSGNGGSPKSSSMNLDASDCSLKGSRGALCLLPIV